MTDWICSPCGHKHGKIKPVQIWQHESKCDWCGKELPVSSSRKWGYPDKPKEMKND